MSTKMEDEFQHWQVQSNACKGGKNASAIHMQHWALNGPLLHERKLGVLMNSSLKTLPRCAAVTKTAIKMLGVH